MLLFGLRFALSSVGASLRPKGLKPNDFSNKEELDIIKADLDKALEFMEYLKEFNAEMEAM